jgi:hypothetical protein
MGHTSRADLAANLTGLRFIILSSAGSNGVARYFLPALDPAGDLAPERDDGSGLCDDLRVARSETPFDRWGRVVLPPESAGSYLLIERESGAQWKVPPPETAVRIWVRRPRAASDDDISNWTVWMHEAQLDEWLSAYKIAEWLPEGVQPDWS